MATMTATANTDFNTSTSRLRDTDMTQLYEPNPQMQS